MAWLYEISRMPDSPTTTLDRRRRRLLFRATHRGTYENDLLLGGFIRAHVATLDDADLTALEALLELPDPDLADWLTGRQPIPPEQAEPMPHGVWPMLRRIRAAVTP
jgi:antitoxin CptB